MSTYLLSTIVAPSFESAVIDVIALSKEEFLELLQQVTDNLCGHPVTNAMLRAEHPSLPEPEKRFWRGDGVAIAARPRGGVRGASVTGDTQVTLDDMEFARVVWRKL
jgi:hypothetical protein